MRPVLTTVVNSVRKFSSTSSGTQTGIKWFKGAIAVALVCTGGSGLLLHHKLKRFLTLMQYLTDEEIDSSREMAQQIIADRKPPPTIAELGSSLNARFLPHAIEREKVAGADVRQRNETQGSTQASEVMWSMFSADQEKSKKINAHHMLFMVYTPEQIEILLKSNKVEALLTNGSLLTAAEIAQLRGQPEEPPRWGDL